MTTTSSIANGSQHATGNQLKVMNALPSDIITEIFSFLNQQDSLACMAVCRDWYDFIPQYAQDLWKELHLDLGDLLKDHKRREKLLGSHVESVVIKQGRTVVAKDVLDASSIHKLRAWGCTNIQFIEFSYLCMDDHLLLTSLQQIAPHLRQLKLTSCNATVAPIYLLDAHPELTHLVCRYSKFLSCSDDDDGIVATPENLACRPSKITHLMLDAVMQYKGQVHQILKRCPELQSFIGRYRGSTDAESDSSTPPIDLNLLFALCPKIAHFSDNHNSDRILRQFYKSSETSMSNQEGLRYLELSTTYGIYQLDQHLLRSQQTLDYLSIDIDSDNDASLILPSLEFPNLRTIRFLKHRYTSDTVIAILNHSPALETLYLENLPPDSSSTPVTRSLNSMRHLRTLIWKTLSDYNDDFCIFTILEHSPIVKNIYINDSLGEVSLHYGETSIENF